MAGLKAIIDAHPDLVILDLGLPDVDGRDLLRMIRAVSRTVGPTTPSTCTCPGCVANWVRARSPPAISTRSAASGSSSRRRSTATPNPTRHESQAHAARGRHELARAGRLSRAAGPAG